MSKIIFDYKEFMEWFDSISPYIGEGKTKDHIGIEGGKSYDFIDKKGNIVNGWDLWFGEAPPEGGKAIQVKGEII